MNWVVREVRPVREVRGIGIRQCSYWFTYIQVHARSSRTISLPTVNILTPPPLKYWLEKRENCKSCKKSRYRFFISLYSSVSVRPFTVSITRTYITTQSELNLRILSRGYCLLLLWGFYFFVAFGGYSFLILWECSLWILREPLL